MEGGTSKTKKEKETKPKFAFSKQDMRDLYLESKFPKSLVRDLDNWSKDKEFKRELIHQLNQWMFQKNEEKRLEESAKVAVRVIDKLLLQKLPLVLVDVYLYFLNQHFKKIQKWLDHKAADKLYSYIPTVFMVNFLSLFKIQLSQKQKHSIIGELIKESSTCNIQLSRLPAIFKNKQYYADVIVKELIANRKDSLAAQVIKKLKMPREPYGGLQLRLIQTSAITMPRWADNFSWDLLEQVYQFFPTAIAACIRSLFNHKKGKKQKQQLQFASICKRNPQVLKNIPQKLAIRFKEQTEILENRLRTNRFEPSDPKTCFLLSDFGYSQKSVIWVNGSNLRESLEKICEQKVIGIDTESRVARTSLDSAYDVLATIQIATPNEAFIFDALALKESNIQIPQIQLFFKNEEVTIVGHTLEADLNGSVTKLLGFSGEVKCKAVDICPIFKILEPQIRPGLASITKTILGKELCKEYTMTNWERRPLLKNQLHYAALDAVIVVKIWQKLKAHKNYESAVLALKKKEKEKRAEQSKAKEEKKQSQKPDFNEENQEGEKEEQTEEHEVEAS